MSRRLRRSLVVVSALTILAAGGALGSSRSSTFANSPARHAHAMVKVHFILNWIPNVEFAGLWVAQHFGWWKAAGIDMSYTPYSLSVHPETDVVSHGGFTFGFQSAAAIDIARTTGVPIKALYADTQKSVFGLAVLQKSGITQVSQLRGKRIGYQPHELYVPATMMANAGLKPSDWKPVQVGFSTDALTQGQVDAYLVFLNNEPIALRLHGVKVRTFAASDYGFHAYDDVLFTTDKLIGSNPGIVRKVTSIVARGFTWAHTHHAAATRITVNGAFKTYVAQNGGKQQQGLEMAAFDQYSKDANGKFSGRMNASTWNALSNTLFKYHETTRRVPASALFTNRFNPNK
ncbi:MAG: hypothetical protein PVSMB7_22640 [Chloroflexota bacterium]